MGDSYLFSDYADLDQYMPQKKSVVSSHTSKNSDVKTNILKILVGVLFAVLIIEAVVYLVIIPCTASVQVRFSGLTQFSPEEIIKMNGINVRQTWINFDVNDISAKLSKSPLFESVEVSKTFPDQVLITVKERKTAAIAIASLNGHSVALQIDKNGYVYRVDGAIPNGNIPIISGLNFDNPRPGVRINSKLRPLLNQIGTILENRPEYFSAISEICISPKDYGEYDLILYPMHSKIKVLADKELNEEALQYMMIVLDVIGRIEPDVSEVDLRYGAVSYKTTGSQVPQILSSVSLHQGFSNGVMGAGR
ncbi:MAG: FtsQ-type POTRA domain-containing protein [Treponemataceae bacterium]|nr:FtsQ-type POTRA domain-containing protein [Treponemataceae bacterium]